MGESTYLREIARVVEWFDWTQNAKEVGPTLYQNVITYLREIARVVEWFDWTQNAKEVGPTLYQNVITQEERKRLGEYYTPRWLAKEITECKRRR